MGVAIGAATENLAIWIALGAAFGVILAAVQGMWACDDTGSGDHGDE